MITNKQKQHMKEVCRCGRKAEFIVAYKSNKNDTFFVCAECICAYRHISLKEYGNTESNFIVKDLK